jgi:putative exosortase-associated protein (TIGR04073 family)
MKENRISKLGILLAIVNGILVVLVFLNAYAYSRQSHGASGWLLLYPILWNLPSSILIMPLSKLPEWVLLPLFVIVGGCQWYLIGWVIEIFFKKVFARRTERNVPKFKQNLVIVLICMSILFLSTSAFAATLPPEGTVQRKLVRGGANIGLGGIEVIYRLQEPDHGQFIPPWFVGVLKGVFYTARRSFVGIYETLTFPVASDPIVQPEFVWEY